MRHSEERSPLRNRLSRGPKTQLIGSGPQPSFPSLAEQPPALERAPNECADVTLIGVRGAAERFDSVHSGMGPTVSGVVDRVEAELRARCPTWRLTRLGLPYPASSWFYWFSRRQGGRSLAHLLSSQAYECPDQRFVLIGLSQGADVVRRGIGHPPLAEGLLTRVAAVVLLGDPTRDPTTGPSWHHGTDDPHPGLLAHFASAVPSSLEARTWSFCLDGDEVAANHRGFMGALRSGSHTQYEENRDKNQDRAAAFIVDQLLGHGPP